MSQSTAEFNTHLEAWQRAGYLSRFFDIAAAESLCNRAVKPLQIVLGDDDRWWVTTPRIAAELERLGYQLT